MPLPRAAVRKPDLSVNDIADNSNVYRNRANLLLLLVPACEPPQIACAVPPAEHLHGGCGSSRLGWAALRALV
eukprot:353182-Chlamydomonas_euryale.AAC.49